MSYICLIKNKGTMMTKEEIHAEALKVKSCGSPLSIEKLEAIIEKNAIRNAKKDGNYNKRVAAFNAKQELKASVKAEFDSMTAGQFDDYKEEQKRQATINQRPSWMR